MSRDPWEVHDLLAEINALRAELDAAKAANAALEARDKEARDALESVHTLLDSAGIDRRHVAYRVNSLINQRDEARGLVRRIEFDNALLSTVRVKVRDAVARWDASRPAPDTNRDGFTLADVNSPEFAELLSQVAHHEEHEPPGDAGDERASEIADEDAMMAGDESGV